MTTTDYLTQLVQDRDDLVDNLETKGITGLTGDETFTELVPEVLNIPSGSSLDWSALGYTEEPASIEDGYDYALQIKNNWNNPVSMFEYFKNDYQLIFMPFININSSATNANGMFSYCASLIEIPLLDFSHITNANYMFNGCSSLKKIPLFDFSNVTMASALFSSCSSLVEIPSLNLSKVSELNYFFQSCNSLTNIGLIDCSSNTGFYMAFSGCKKLKNLGGFKDYGKAFLTSASANYANYKLDLSASNNITHDSLMNVINNLYDIATAGVQTQQLVIGSTNLAKLTAEEIAIATNKGWSVS